ncbi:hypothetical protein PMAYCL1PPCAC_13865, partial [Pristionchus mayeri]
GLTERAMVYQSLKIEMASGNQTIVNLLAYHPGATKHAFSIGMGKAMSGVPFGDEDIGVRQICILLITLTRHLPSLSPFSPLLLGRPSPSHFLPHS